MMRKQRIYAPFQQIKGALYGTLLITSLILTSCQPASANGARVPVLAPPPTVPLETPQTFPTTEPSTTPTQAPTATTAATATTTTTETTTPGNPVGQTGSWRLIFHDEFDGSSLDTTKWNTCYFNFTVGNGCTHNQGELELYQPNEVSVANGALTLRADKQSVTAADGKTYNYTSGMISTGPASGGTSSLFTFTYGYMEMRAQVPAGQGLWPAFWTLPADLSWPPEIDVMEILGNAPNVINMHYHYPIGNGGDGKNGADWTGPDFSAGWHTYAVDWEPGSITWYVDGVMRQQYTNANVASKPMYLVANLAVGGDWPGAPNASTTFPSSFQIDYIRVWQK